MSAEGKGSPILAIAVAVRSACEKLFPHRDKLQNLCTLSACAIIKLATTKRLKAYFVGGTFSNVAPIPKPEFGNPEHIRIAREPLRSFPHAWVQYRRNYIDVTLTQFSRDAEPVSILEIGDQRYKGRLEPIGFAELCLPLCGSSAKELEDVVAEAKRMLNANSAIAVAL